ncbi:YitT family protein [Mahella sp.]|jgi:uncharacterized membrane-anchored protein YitT (DUF2179 family)|uniref:YitT family protein n=1 Tax=Mahella sp. TaxID=2798721 RepID=UPI0025B9BBB7|nr:YitT family protein [Mahella sp.]
MWRRYRDVFYDYLGIIVGTLIVALSFNLFFVPNKIAPGGVGGIATVLYYLFEFPVGTTMLILNIPLFLAGVKVHGAGFGFKTLIATVLLSFFIDAIKLQPLTHNEILASVYGGIIMGIGLGIVFRSDATTGGTDLAAKIVHKFMPYITMGWLLFMIDTAVVTLAGTVFGPEQALYAIIALFISSYVIDLIQEGLGSSKAFIVVSDKADEISKAILHDIDRGVTLLEGRGAYTQRKKDVILCVVSRTEVIRLKEIITAIDNKAFLIITDAREVHGEGF